MKAKTIEYVLKTIIKKSGRDTFLVYKWDEPLVLNNKEIEDIYWDGQNFNIVYYENGEPTPLRYRDEIEVKPNKHLIKLFFSA